MLAFQATLTFLACYALSRPHYVRLDINTLGGAIDSFLFACRLPQATTLAVVHSFLHDQPQPIHGYIL
jgi:hypothetical protein